jgi:hypothetical protein
MIKLSVRGTRLLKQAKRLRLTAALGTFTPATRHAVTATKRFTLLR